MRVILLLVMAFNVNHLRIEPDRIGSDNERENEESPEYKDRQQCNVDAD
jgi:hypothetical protein